MTVEEGVQGKQIKLVAGQMSGQMHPKRVWSMLS
jgi:hypothetical protein